MFLIPLIKLGTRVFKMGKRRENKKILLFFVKQN